jgi:hypothetical protein
MHSQLPQVHEGTAQQQFIMATRLGNWSHVEIHAVIQSLWMKKVSAAKINHQLIAVYGKTVISCQHTTVAETYAFGIHVLIKIFTCFCPWNAPS